MIAFEEGGTALGYQEQAAGTNNYWNRLLGQTTTGTRYWDKQLLEQGTENELLLVVM